MISGSLIGRDAVHDIVEYVEVQLICISQRDSRFFQKVASDEGLLDIKPLRVDLQSSEFPKST